MKESRPSKAAAMASIMRQLDSGEDAIQHLDRAQAMMEAGKYDDALQVFHKMIRSDLMPGHAWVGRAEVYKKLGKYQTALECCKKAIEVDPDFDIHSDRRRELMYEIEDAERERRLAQEFRGRPKRLLYGH